MVVFDGLEQVLGGVVDPCGDFTKSFSVCSPEDDDFIEIIGLFELTDVLSDLLKVSEFVITLQDIVCSFYLVESDKILVVDCGQRVHIFHVGL